MEKKMIYEYYRKKGKLKGVVVAFDKDTYGWSLCSNRDVFNKEKGLQIAINRAIKASTLYTREKREFYSKVPRSLQELFEKVKERAIKYYG